MLPMRMGTPRAAAMPIMPSPTATSDPTPWSAKPWLAMVNNRRPDSSTSSSRLCSKPRSSARPSTVTDTRVSRSVQREIRAVSSAMPAAPRLVGAVAVTGRPSGEGNNTTSSTR